MSPRICDSRRVKILLGLVAVMACGAPEGAAPRAVEDRPSEKPAGSHRGEIPYQEETVADPAPFFDVLGLRKVMVSVHAETLYCSSTRTRLRLVRGNDVVCEADLSSTTSCEGTTQHWYSGVELHSREPLQFDVKGAGDVFDNVHGSDRMNDSCVRYELPPHGKCRRVVVRTCPPASGCLLDVRTSRRPGSGRLVATFTHDGKPLAAEQILIDGWDGVRGATDERGRVERAVDAGDHEIRLIDLFPASPISFYLGSDSEDAVVEVARTACPCCGP